VEDDKGRTIKVIPDQITEGPSEYSKEQLENYLLANISRPIPNLIILPITKDSGEKIFMIDVPESDSPPHQAGDKCYYRRENFQNRKMEHVEIEDMFGKRQRPNLYPIFEYKKRNQNVVEGFIQISLIIHNKGRAIGKYVCFSISLHNIKDLSLTLPLRNISHLRELSSFQFRDDVGIIHSEERMSIGSFAFGIKNPSEPIIGEYLLFADGMKFRSGILIIPPIQFNNLLKNKEEKEIELYTIDKQESIDKIQGELTRDLINYFDKHKDEITPTPKKE
jgi:hypothetical protein